MSLYTDVIRTTIILLFCILLVTVEINCIGEVIWAVNCGGEAHSDVHGVRYQRDTLVHGVASDYGKNMLIQRVMPQDQILYQTERYHTDSFGYEVPIRQDGDYVLVLKFSEVWFASSNQKVFDVVLNGEHTVVDDLDIFFKVGHSTGHDELIPFSVKSNKLKVAGETSQLHGKLSVEFVKGDHDNPKVNAIYVMRGTVEDVPKLLPPVSMNSPHGGSEAEEEDDDEEVEEPRKQKRRPIPTSERVPDPYAADDTSSMMLPVFVAIGAFLPLLFCLCKL